MGLAYASKSKLDQQNTTEKISERAWSQNHPQRITGDGACIVAEYLQRKRSGISREVIYKLVQTFVTDQVRGGVVDMDWAKSPDARSVSLMISKIHKILRNYREGL
jgi:hypothetical protein